MEENEEEFIDEEYHDDREGEVIDISDDDVPQTVPAEEEPVAAPDQDDVGEISQKSLDTTSPGPQSKEKEIVMTQELRGLLTGYPGFIIFENKEDSFSLIKDMVLIYKLICYCEVKSKKENVKKELEKMRKDLEKKQVLNAIEYYNDYISRGMNFGMSRVKRQLDMFVNVHINFLMKTVQYWIFVLPFKSKKDMHLDNAHGLPAATAEDFEREQIERGETVTDLEGPFKIDDEGEVIQVT